MSEPMPKRRSDATLYWISLMLTLAVLIPLLTCLVLYTGWQGESQARQVEKIESGVPILRPGPSEDITVLAVVAQERPSFVLLRFNAPEAKLQISSLPGESVLRSPKGAVLLADSYRSAGPGRAAELIGETLEVTIDRYLALTPESIRNIWGSLEPPRLDLSSLLSSQELGGLGRKDDPVISLPLREAEKFLDALDPGPARRARLECAIWDAALRQRLDSLPKVLIRGLRSESGSLLGNISAADLFRLEKSLEWLVRQETQVEAEPVPGSYNRHTDRYEFDADSIAFVKERFAKPSELAPRPAPATPDEA